MKNALNKKNFHVVIFAALVALLLFPTVVRASTFEFVPSSSILNDCTNQVDIYIDPKGEQVNAADIEIYYEKNKIEIIDSDSGTSGKQIQVGESFQNYWGNYVYDILGSILLAGGNTSDNTTTLNMREKFASIKFLAKSQPAGASINFRIRFDNIGNTIDSNLADKNDGHDLLTSVVNGNYILGVNCDNYGNITGNSSSITPVSYDTTNIDNNNSNQESFATQLTSYLSEENDEKILSAEFYEYSSFLCLCLCCPSIGLLYLFFIKKKEGEKNKKVNIHDLKSD